MHYRGAMPNVDPDLQEVRRTTDDELCGYIAQRGGAHVALTVFHGELATFDSDALARQHVLDHGLASLHRHWHFRNSPQEEWQLVLIQEARPGWARIVLGYYSLPGVPTREVRLHPSSPVALVLEPGD